MNWVKILSFHSVSIMNVQLVKHWEESCQTRILNLKGFCTSSPRDSESAIPKPSAPAFALVQAAGLQSPIQPPAWTISCRELDNGCSTTWYHAGIGNKESWIFPHLSYYCCFRGCEAKSLSPIFVSYLSLQEIIKISLAILLRENKDTEKKKCDSPRGWHDWNQNSVFLFSSPGHWIQLLSITLLNA